MTSALIFGGKNGHDISLAGLSGDMTVPASSVTKTAAGSFSVRNKDEMYCRYANIIPVKGFKEIINRKTALFIPVTWGRSVSLRPGLQTRPQFLSLGRVTGGPPAITT